MPILVFFLWWILLPEELIIRYLQESLLAYGLEANFVGFHKDWCYRIRSESVLLRRSEEPLLRIEQLTGEADMLALARLRPTLTFQGKVGSGDLQGRLSSRIGKREGAELDLRFERLPLEEIFPLIGMDIAGHGLIRGKGHLANGRGALRFRIEDLRLQGDSQLAGAIPLELFSGGSGAFRLDEKRGLSFSLFLEGEDIHARLRGEREDGNTNLTLEVMPAASLIRQRPHWFLLLEQYQAAPGYYIIHLPSDLFP